VNPAIQFRLSPLSFFIEAHNINELHEARNSVKKKKNTVSSLPITPRRTIRNQHSQLLCFRIFAALPLLPFLDIITTIKNNDYTHYLHGVNDNVLLPKKTRTAIITRNFVKAFFFSFTQNLRSVYREQKQQLP
jgi:hypothetical protein